MRRSILTSFIHSPYRDYNKSLVLSRIAIGLFFFVTGLNKIVEPSANQSMLNTIQSIGFPFPHVIVFVTSASEALFGLLLTLGLLTRLSAGVLILIMLVALSTHDIATGIPAGLPFWTSYTYLLYLPQILYVIILIPLVLHGSDHLSLDRWLYNYMVR